MVKYVIDSASDLKEYPGIDLNLVPLTLATDDKQFVGDKYLNVPEVLDFFSKHHGRSFTSCPSTQAWLDAYEGGDEIYVVTITSGLSGTYNGANVAKDQYLSEHPDSKICIVDSLATGPGEVLLMEKIVELKAQGKSFEEVSKEIIDYRNHLRLFFGLGSLHNLAQNGRVSKLVASAVGIMNIRVLGTASKEGKIDSIGKFRGEKKLLSGILEEIKKTGYKNGKIRICHVENQALSLSLEEALKEEFGQVDIKSIPAGGLCSFYAERNGIIVGVECM